MQIDSLKKKVFRKPTRNLAVSYIQHTIYNIHKKGGRLFFWLIVLIAVLGLTSLAVALNAPTADPPSGGGNAIGAANGAPSNTLYISASGQIGIGTASPDQKLTVSGNLAGYGIHVDSSSGAGIELDRGATSNYYGVYFETADTVEWHIGNDGDSTGSFKIMDGLAGVDVVTVEDGTPANTLYLDSTGQVGIGGDVTVGGGSGKINVGTVDPVYDINGVKYATYLPGMTGQKEETAGVVKLQPQNGAEIYAYTIDFSKAEVGSDLWLFKQVTDFSAPEGRDLASGRGGGESWNNLAVLLSANFSGQVWYEKDAGKNRITIFAIPRESAFGPQGSAVTYEVSYRLTAPRFDWQKWGNLSEDQSLEGLRPGN